MDTPLWQPTDEAKAATNLARFMELVEDDWDIDVSTDDALHDFSITYPDKFWTSLKDFACISAETWGDTALADADDMMGAKFFPGARLNYAENMLQRRDDEDALVFWGEDQVKQHISANTLYERVSQTAQALLALGVQPGDHIAGYLPNMCEAIIAMLATSSIGAVWSSCSPDFGVQGVLDRFGQIEPRVLFCVDGYYYGGKRHDCTAKVQDILAGLPSVEKTVVVEYAGGDGVIATLPNAVSFTDFADPYAPGEIAFTRLPFNHPLFVMFSSGTTGIPKCIVHGQGGTLLQHAKEHRLHCDIKPGDRVFYFTTCGWMMWNWLASALGAGATVLLYDGSPFYPDGNALFDFADAAGMTFFGTSAKYLDALKNASLAPIETHKLEHLRTIASTGSPLVAEGFDYVYQRIKTDVHLASISGGTDIVSCFVLGNPRLAVWRGEIQGPGLGMAVDAFDDDGRPVRSGKGDMVCTKPFPSMPVCFWNDPDDAKYKAAYFEAFPGVWTHGDWIEKTVHGGFIIHGRSDATLNPGGVRIGTAEIYRQVEKLDEIRESIAIGQDWDGDVRVVLFVVMSDDEVLDDRLNARIKSEIRSGASPRHVPAKILEVPDIPRTRSGKITELAVRDVVHGRAVRNQEALANAEALSHFANRWELDED
ncbi:acetoacetate--CoA ligase [Pseudomonadota bacterium]